MFHGEHSYCPINNQTISNKTCMVLSSVIDDEIELCCSDCQREYNFPKLSRCEKYICCCFALKRTAGHTCVDEMLTCCSICRSAELIKTEKVFWNLDKALCLKCHFHIEVKYSNFSFDTLEDAHRDEEVKQTFINFDTDFSVENMF